MKLVEKARTEPAAALILTNLLRYLDAYTSPHRQTAVLGGDTGYRDSLRRLGLRFDDLSNLAPAEEFGQYSLILCRDVPENADVLTEKLNKFLERGGNLYLHRPVPASVDAISQGLKLGIDSRSLAGPLRKADGEHPLLQAISREDLYWTIKQPGLSWVRQPLAQEMIGGVFAQTVDPGQATSPELTPLTEPAAVAVVDHGSGRIVFDHLRWDTEQANGRKAARYACSLLTALGADFTPRSAVVLECEVMTPEPGLDYFSNTGGIVSMGTNGAISAQIEVAKSRPYTMELTASGDASQDICPLVEVHVDGHKMGDVQLTIEDWQTYPLVLDLEKGQHELSLKFVNDHASPSGDRNLRLDKVSFYND